MPHIESNSIPLFFQAKDFEKEGEWGREKGNFVDYTATIKTSLIKFSLCWNWYELILIVQRFWGVCCWFCCQTLFHPQIFYYNCRLFKPQFNNRAVKGNFPQTHWWSTLGSFACGTWFDASLFSFLCTEKLPCNFCVTNEG